MTAAGFYSGAVCRADSEFGTAGEPVSILTC